MATVATSVHDYETELTGDRADVAAALSGVVDGLLAGSLRVGEDEALSVDLPDELSLEVEFEADGDERSLELELEWDGDADEADITPAEAVEPLAVPEEQETAEGEAAEAEAGEPEAETVFPLGAGEAAQSLARFELYRDTADEWRWRLRHRNGNVIATSGEGYTRKANARKGLRSVVSNAPGASVEES